MPWQPCVDFSEAMGGGIAEESPTKLCSSAVVLWMPPSYVPSERTFPMGSNVGKVLSVIQTYSIAMVKRFLKLFISSSVFPPLLSPVQVFSISRW